MNNLLFLLCLLFTLSSCFNSEPLHYDDELIKFTLPKGWKEIKVEEKVAGSKYLIFQKGRFVAKGLVTIIIRDGEKDLKSIIRSYRKSMKELDTEMFSIESNFESAKPGKFGSYETMTSKYGMVILGVKSKGQIHAFHAGNKTILLGLQEMDGNEGVYDEVLIELEGSLIIK